MIIRPSFIAVLTLALSTAVAGASPVVYAITNTQQFGTINLSTGAFTSIGPGTLEGSVGLVQGPNGGLLTLTYSGNLDSINSSTGVTTVVGATGLGDCTTPASPCPSNSADVLGKFGGKFYATDFSNNLYSVDPSTGAATLIGATGIPDAPGIIGSSNPDGSINLSDETLFESGGKFYATFDAATLDLTTFTFTPVITPELYQINPLTGVATAIAPTALTLNSVINVNGSVYGFESGTDTVVSLNLSNGNTSYIADFDPNLVAICGVVAPVPEPTSIVLVGSGILAMAAGVRRRRSVA